MFRGLGQAPDSPVTGTAAWLASACAILSKDAFFGPILNDPDAIHFANAISAEAPAVLAKFDDPALRAAYFSECDKAQLALMTVVAYRKPQMERLVCDALSATGADQLVILGAGCDTLSLRLARQRITPKTVEIDRPEVIFFREHVKAGIALDLSHVCGIGVDFEHENFGEKLLANGYDAKARAVFYAEGLLGYLRAAAVDDIFQFIKSHSGAGSRCVFSFTQGRTGVTPDGQLRSADLEQQGEAPVFDLSPTEAGDFVEARGLRVVEMLTAADLTDMYRDRYQNRIRILPFLHLAVVET